MTKNNKGSIVYLLDFSCLHSVLVSHSLNFTKKQRKFWEQKVFKKSIYVYQKSKWFILDVFRKTTHFKLRISSSSCWDFVLLRHYWKQLSNNYKYKLMLPYSKMCSVTYIFYSTLYSSFEGFPMTVLIKVFAVNDKRNQLKIEGIKVYSSKQSMTSCGNIKIKIVKWWLTLATLWYKI